MKNLLIFFTLTIFLAACGGNSDKPSADSKDKGKQEAPVDDGKGIGEIKDVKLNSPLLADLVATGKGIYELKCAACHKLTDKRVVGPGWAGVTDKRNAEWIMNMTLNVEVMLEKDPAARELLKECLVRMPNQNLTKEEARAVLEFMYANDGLEVGS